LREAVALSLTVPLGEKFLRKMARRRRWGNVVTSVVGLAQFAGRSRYCCRLRCPKRIRPPRAGAARVCTQRGADREKRSLHNGTAEKETSLKLYSRRQVVNAVVALAVVGGIVRLRITCAHGCLAPAVNQFAELRFVL